MNKLSFLLIPFILPAPSNCQSLFKSFSRLSGPEKCWTLGHIFVAGKAFRITTESRNMTARILLDGLLDQYPNGGKADAFRHGYWMARTTQAIGEKKTLKLGRAHEKGNYKDFIKGRLEDGMRADSLSGVMDLSNNSTGINLGKKGKDLNPDSLKQAVIDLIKNGGFLILKRNKEGELINCDGKIVVKSSHWALPYCLVSSNYSP